MTDFSFQGELFLYIFLCCAPAILYGIDKDSLKFDLLRIHHS